MSILNKKTAPNCEAVLRSSINETPQYIQKNVGVEVA